VLFFIEQSLGELQHVESQVVVRELGDASHSILPHSFVWELCVEKRNGFFWLHRCPVEKHLVDFVDLDGSVPLNAPEEYW